MHDGTPYTNPITKLLKRPAAIIAVAIISISVLIAIFAYVLAPDNTPFANRMIVELGAREPGFTKLLLYIPKTTEQEKPSAITRLFQGTPNDYKAIPINSYDFSGNSIMVSHYIDDGLSDTLTYKLSNIIPTAQLTDDINNNRDYVTTNLISKKTFYLGTDRYGRDILSRLLIGTRISLAVGFIAVVLSITIGILLGAIAGYFGGRIDNIVMWLINILWSIPTLLLVFAITLTIGKGFWQIFIAIGLTMWVSAARLIRGQVMSLKEMEYITAAKAIGVNDFRIITKHILPNIAGPIMVIAASNFATAILIEAGLSFLGIGVQPPTPSWGLMIKEHYNFLLTNRPFLAIVPGIAIMLLVYAFNIVGNGLRDVLDVKD
ncbi:MAG: ABC transporter permease [Chitinophagales bacterium]|nr:ABC transporter permease [Chitinophagaceae bacterium]MCB9066100.1 ABC transporter permease [Chitinophagales bacterium]